MRLYRLAMLHFNPCPKGWDAWSTHMGVGSRMIHVSTVPTRTTPLDKKGGVPPSKGLLIKAIIELGELPQLDEQHRVNVPTDARAAELNADEAKKLVQRDR